MVEQFFIGLSAVAAVVLPVAVVQARNTKLQIDNAIKVNNDELLRRINGTYVKREVLDQQLEAIKWRLGHVEDGD